MVDILLNDKRQVFLHMEEMKKKYPFPKDYDYEQARRKNMDEKYDYVGQHKYY